MVKKDRVPEISGGIDVLGVKFQAFIHPKTNQAIFSRSSVSRSLEISLRSIVRIIESEQFKALRGEDFQIGRLLTTVSPRSIAVVTQTDLVCIVKIASEKGFPVAKSMQDASFAVLLQQSIDEKLNVSRSRKEYLDAGANARQKLKYLHSYNAMKQSVFDGKHGVRILCKVNRQVSEIAVPDADERREKDKNWRRKCNEEETVKITIGNTVHQKAVDASSKESLDKNLGIAEDRTKKIYDIMDQPFH